MIIESVLCEPTAKRGVKIRVTCNGKSPRYMTPKGLSPLQQHQNAVCRYLLDMGIPLQGHSGIGGNGRYVWSVVVVNLLEC